MFNNTLLNEPESSFALGLFTKYCGLSAFWGALCPGPLEWGHVSSSTQWGEKGNALPGWGIHCQGKAHWLSLLKCPRTDSGCMCPHSVLPVKGLISSFHLSETCWDSFSDDPPPSSTLLNSPYHCGLRREGRQMLVLNSLFWKGNVFLCTQYHFIHTSPIYSFPNEIFLYSFFY